MRPYFRQSIDCKLETVYSSRREKLPWTFSGKQICERSMTFLRKPIVAIALVVVVTPATTWLTWHFTRMDAGVLSVAETAMTVFSDHSNFIDRGTQATRTSTGALAAELAPVTMRWNEVLDRAVTIHLKAAKSQADTTADTQAALNELAGVVARDPLLRLELIRRLQTGSDEMEKATIKSILSMQANPDVVTFSRELTGSNRASERSQGLELLLTMPPNAQTYKDVAQALEQERDRGVVIGAVAASLARPPQTPTAESEALVQRFRALSQHEDPAVRRLSIRALAQWDQSAQIDADLQRSLADPREEVRLAAVSTIGANSRRTESMKSNLVEIAYSVREAPEVRQAALSALRSLPLTDEEAAGLDVVRRDLDLHHSNQR